MLGKNVVEKCWQSVFFGELLKTSVVQKRKDTYDREVRREPDKSVGQERCPMIEQRCMFCIRVVVATKFWV